MPGSQTTPGPTGARNNAPADFAKAIREESVRWAMRLDPLYSPDYLRTLAISLFHQHRYEEAVTTIERVRALLARLARAYPEALHAPRLLNGDGSVQRSRDLLDELRAMVPGAESLVDVEGEFEGGDRAGGVDAVVVVPGQAGEHVVDDGRVGAAVGQVDGPLSGETTNRCSPLATRHTRSAPAFRSCSKTISKAQTRCRRRQVRWRLSTTSPIATRRWLRACAKRAR